VQVVKLHTKDEAMTVHAFTKTVLSGPFSNSLIRCCPKTFCEIKHQVVAHIVAEDRVTEKRSSVGPVRPRGTGRPQPMRVHEATTEKKAPGAQPPYEARKPQTGAHTRENIPPRHNLWGDLKEMIAIRDVVSRLKPSSKTNKKLGPSKSAWCKFHQATGHNLRSCLALGF